MLNERLNMSQLILEKEIGTEAVDQLVNGFKAEADKDPSLYQKMYANLHPYAFVKKHMENARRYQEIGDDPAAYEARLREKWLAEVNAGTVPLPVSPAAGLQPSLANVRSVAARSTPAFSGPPAMGDILQRAPKSR
jgi:hypothetical protein